MFKLRGKHSTVSVTIGHYIFTLILSALVFLLIAILGTAIVYCNATEEEKDEVDGVLSVEHIKIGNKENSLHREVRAAPTTSRPARASTSRKPIISAKSTTRKGKPATTRRSSTYKATSKKVTTRRPTTGSKGPGGKVSSPKPRPPVQSTPKPPTKLLAGNSVRK